MSKLSKWLVGALCALTVVLVGCAAVRHHVQKEQALLDVHYITITVYVQCDEPVYYEFTDNATVVVISKEQMEKDARLALVVGKIIAFQESHGNFPLIVDMTGHCA